MNKPIRGSCLCGGVPSARDQRRFLEARIAAQRIPVRKQRREADSLTSRAQKLAPESDEVKRLRTEVVKLL
jgi:hypothetical protein